jgi:hypothetical protein
VEISIKILRRFLGTIVFAVKDQILPAPIIQSEERLSSALHGEPAIQVVFLAVKRGLVALVVGLLGFRIVMAAIVIMIDLYCLFCGIKHYIIMNK